MTSRADSQTVADLAQLIVDNGLHATTSALDGDSAAWSKPVAEDLLSVVAHCNQSEDFAPQLLRSLEDFPREVSLLAVELLALALLPIKNVDQAEIDLFGRLVAGIRGCPIDIPGVLWTGIETGGFRRGCSTDNLGERLLWLARYACIGGRCPDYVRLIERGDDEYLGHEDLHDTCPFELSSESPWVSVGFSAEVDSEDRGMRFDFDHMMWPDFLAPPAVRKFGEQIRINVAGLLHGFCKDWEEHSGVALAKDLYLAKQIVGSWEELFEFHQQEWSPH